MKTASFLVLLVGASLSASLSVGCLGFGCDAPNNGYRAPLELKPASTLAFRTPAACGAIDPAFSPADSFSLELTGDTPIVVDVAPGVAVGQSVPLVVEGGKAHSQDGTIQFEIGGAAALDASPLDSVVVTIEALPAADGQLLSVELHLGFDDGSALDDAYAAPVQTTFVSCPSNG